MALSIEQSFEYQKDDWWKWSVWIEGPSAELDAIKSVVYTLHHTFPNPVREMIDRGTKFKLSASGWGVFMIYATVTDKAKNETELSHYLRLEYPDGTPTTK